MTSYGAAWWALDADASAPSWTSSLEQLLDVQTDLMLSIADVPDLRPHYDADGFDPILRMRNRADNGTTPHGIVSGEWMWALDLTRYPEALWPAAVAQAKWFGWTHWFLHVAEQKDNGGYHGLYDNDHGWAAGEGERLNRACAFLRANRLIPVCAGVAPDAPPAPGFDCSTVDVAMTDWDNTNFADSRIDAIADAFPNARVLIYERPGPDPRVPPQADAHSTVVPTETNGGAWIRSVQRRHPAFLAVAYEVNLWEGLDGAAAEIERCGGPTSAHPFYRDLQQIRFETDTYVKYWQGGPKRDYDAANDALQARCPFLKGYASGGTPHPPPPDEQTGSGVLVSGDGFVFADAVQSHGPACTQWPATTQITRLEVRPDGIRVVFDAAARWPDFTPPGWEGPIQYSLGMAMKIDGRWYIGAPIEFYRELVASGGPIYDRSVQPDNGIAGQVAAHWFDRASWWGALCRQPDPGERVGFFAIAADGRGDAVGAQERSNVVVVPFPSGPISFAVTP